MNTKKHNAIGMENEYLLSNIELLGLKMKKINYSFDCCNTTAPTMYIKIVVHHVGYRKTIQEIIDLHVKKKRWSSIGYHFLIDKVGKIYSARDLKYAGAHTFGFNKHSIGVALFGHFDNDEPTQKQIEALKRLTNAINENYKIRKILGHNQAIYELIRKKYWQLKLPKINPMMLGNKNEFVNFIKNTTTKVLEFDNSDETVRLLKRLKTCPGQNMYPIVLQLQEEHNQKKLEG